MSNHLIIGLGGTGGKIIRSFRKTIFQEFRQERPDNVSIEYLYVDSDASMMGNDDASWKILGNNVQLGKENQLLIEGANLERVLNNINNYPGMKEWIGDRSQWQHILDGLGAARILGGQKRRLGRFLFANKVEEFNQQIQKLVLKLQHQGGSRIEVTFHVCCGLAGGTGSGSLIDVLTQLRETYPDSNIYKILVYALLPEEHPHQNWNTGNYWANGYAALVELNALSAGRFQPCDITGQKKRLTPKDVFTGCYLFSNKNQNGLAVDVDVALPNILADFLYMKIVSTRYAAGWSQILERIEKFENLDSTPEMAPGSNLPERSRKFLTFGIKRLAVPEEEIHEYLTYSFANQTALHFLYNAWQDGAGYLEQPKNRGFNHEVRQRELLQRWKLTDAHICLSDGIFEADQKSKPIQEDWQSYFPTAKQFVRDNCEIDVWPDELKKICFKRFEQNYRGVGVANFYRQRLGDKIRLVNEIVQGIEQDLFTEWKNRNYSMEEIASLLKALISSIDERLKEVDRRIQGLNERKEDLEEKMDAVDREWAKTGLKAWLSNMVFNKREDLFNQQAANLQDICICRTWIEGWRFAKEFLPELINGLTDLEGHVKNCLHTVKQASDVFKKNIASRINAEGEKDLKMNLVRFYKPDAVRKLGERFQKDQEEQRNQIKQVRDALIARMGANASFKKFNEALSLSVFVDTLEGECETFVKRYHDMNVAQNPHEKLLGASIIEKLKDEYGGNIEKLRSFMADLVAFAGNYVIFDENDAKRQESGIPQGPTRVSHFMVLMPNPAEYREFITHVEEALRRSRREGVEIVHSDHRSNEITMISITNLFPLRYLQAAHFLKEKYDLRMDSSDADRLKLELHLEGDGMQHPPLLAPQRTVVIARGIPYVLLGELLHLIQQEENEVTGLMEYLLKTKDVHGFDNEPIPLGKTVADIPDRLDSRTINILEAEVNKVLERKEYLHIEKRQQLKEQLHAEIEALKNEYGPNSELYKLFRDGAKKAADLLSRER